MDIAIAFRDQDGTYTRHAGAMLASLLATTPRPFRVHILHDHSLTPANTKKLLALPWDQEREIHFHRLDPQTLLPGTNEHTAIMRPLTYASLYRLFLPQLPALAPCPRILYMDTDIIVDTDLGELWDTDMGPALLGAVPDPLLCKGLSLPDNHPQARWARRVARTTLHQGVPMTRYFNSGVLLLKLDDIGRQGLFAEALDFVRAHPALVHPDQDALNKVFYTRSMTIPQKFNCILHSNHAEDREQGVWHYSGACKPWLDPHMPKAHRYHHYLRQTPWAQEYA